MAQTSERRVHRADHELDPSSLKRQHFCVAKCLRDYWVARIQITNSHCGKRIPETESTLCNVVGQALRFARAASRLAVQIVTKYITGDSQGSQSGIRGGCPTDYEYGRRSACPTIKLASTLLRKPHVLTGIHLEIQHQRLFRIRLDYFLHEFHVDRVLAKDGIFVHRFEIDGDEKRPVDFLVDSLAAFDAQNLRDLEELHPRIHHHLLHAGGGDLVLQFVEDDMVNHEGKANRRFHRGVQVQSALSDAPMD